VSPPERIGSYRVERLLGTGSFATVWLGYDEALGAHVAIKVLADNWSHDLRVRERFLDEGRLLWRLDHERVVRVHALGELPDGRPYLVMAWAEGGSLRDRLADGPVPVLAGLRLLREIASGVAVLHRAGIVHRDLTPGNILFRPAGAEAEQVVIADLGLAKALAAASGLTARAGTPGYMAPEQDDPRAVVDTRTDVYGLGRLGRRLLGRDHDDELRLRPGVPPRVADVLRRATARRAADRYPDAAAFGAALDRATTPVGPEAVRRRRAATLALMSVLAVAVMALAADSVVGRSPGVSVVVPGPVAPPATSGRPTSGPTAGAPSPSDLTATVVVPPSDEDPEVPPTPSTIPPTEPTEPTPTATASSTPESPCFGSVRHVLIVPDIDFERLTPLCFAAGGVLRLQNIEPGLVTADPDSLVSSSYEAGGVDLYLLRPGTVTVTVPRDGVDNTITVVIIR
jgi:serine/threonine protein kinase